MLQLVPNEVLIHILDFVGLPSLKKSIKKVCALWYSIAKTLEVRLWDHTTLLGNLCVFDTLTGEPIVKINLPRLKFQFNPHENVIDMSSTGNEMDFGSGENNIPNSIPRKIRSKSKFLRFFSKRMGISDVSTSTSNQLQQQQSQQQQQQSQSSLQQQLPHLQLQQQSQSTSSVGSSKPLSQTFQHLIVQDKHLAWMAIPQTDQQSNTRYDILCLDFCNCRIVYQVYTRVQPTNNTPGIPNTNGSTSPTLTKPTNVVTISEAHQLIQNKEFVILSGGNCAIAICKSTGYIHTLINRSDLEMLDVIEDSVTGENFSAFFVSNQMVTNKRKVFLFDCNNKLTKVINGVGPVNPYIYHPSLCKSFCLYNEKEHRVLVYDCQTGDLLHRVNYNVQQQDVPHQLKVITGRKHILWGFNRTWCILNVDKGVMVNDAWSDNEDLNGIGFRQFVESTDCDVRWVFGVTKTDVRCFENMKDRSGMDLIWRTKEEEVPFHPQTNPRFPSMFQYGNFRFYVDLNCQEPRYLIFTRQAHDMRRIFSVNNRVEIELFCITLEDGMFLWKEEVILHFISPNFIYDYNVLVSESRKCVMVTTIAKEITSDTTVFIQGHGLVDGRTCFEHNFNNSNMTGEDYLPRILKLQQEIDTITL